MLLLINCNDCIVRKFVFVYFDRLIYSIFEFNVIEVGIQYTYRYSIVIVYKNYTLRGSRKMIHIQ